MPESHLDQVETLLYWVEVRRIPRQVLYLDAVVFTKIVNISSTMDGCIVHEDDTIWTRIGGRHGELNTPAASVSVHSLAYLPLFEMAKIAQQAYQLVLEEVFNRGPADRPRNHLGGDKPVK